MSREKSHKGSGHPRKREPSRKGLNDRSQAAGSNQQQIEEEERREGERFADRKPEEEGERAIRSEATP